MQREPNSIPLVLVIKSDFFNLFGIIPTYAKVRFGTDIWTRGESEMLMSSCMHFVYALIYQGK